MMSTRGISFGAAPHEASRTRHLIALLLHAAAITLGQLAHRLVRAEPEPAGEPVLEFYAQAGAPEGALYVDGKLVGLLSGVSRL
jgi:hypothetical protein